MTATCLYPLYSQSVSRTHWSISRCNRLCCCRGNRALRSIALSGLCSARGASRLNHKERKMAASGNGLLGRGLDISLAALQQQDPYIRGIVDVASQVALYTFSHKANEWEKTDVEGTLFIYTRSASPKHGFTIMNRLSMENRTEPITKDLDFQLQDPFLLYRNARFFIYGIWFYDKEECQRIAELMKNLTQQEQLKAQQGDPSGISPMSLNLADTKEVDILQMLTKAKDEYTKCKPSSEPKLISSSSAIYSNPNLIKPIAVKPTETQLQPAGITSGTLSDLEPQHLSLTTLFGKPDKAQEGRAQNKEHSTVRHTVVRSLSYEEPSRVAERCENQLCPAIQKLMVRGPGLHPVSEIPENRQSHNGNFQPGGSILTGLFQQVAPNTSFSILDHESGESILHTLHSAQSTLPKSDLGPHPPSHCFSGVMPSPSGKDTIPSLINYYDCSLQSQRTSTSVPQLPLASQHPPAGTISPQELLRKLHLVRQEQQLPSSSRPALAAKFPVIPQSGPKPTYDDKIPGTMAAKPNTLLQVISPQRIPATVSPALLMSPTVFSQPNLHKATNTTKATIPVKETLYESSRLLLPLLLPDAPACSSGTGTQSTILTKHQLQGTLLHLIQNDESFLNTIYETYLSVVAKCANSGRKI
ncbi:mRNA-decapping enzyme 1B isoform X1 [Pelobates cultripes]|uniref:5'-(N(7)-methylguanosine 5'-triphospho)-[mRNA] hydrolase n=1 Tax=Pelobates cultripes TaxID=61616 RepID=A0AAD1RTR5_PELCU|nr:mRNA-decapping enzyme 1B isoform X1 [Pelobates cultripes]